LYADISPTNQKFWHAQNNQDDLNKSKINQPDRPPQYLVFLLQSDMLSLMHT
jgi:hypothetical protein